MVLPNSFGVSCPSNKISSPRPFFSFLPRSSNLKLGVPHGALWGLNPYLFLDLKRLLAARDDVTGVLQDDVGHECQGIMGNR